MLVSDERIYKKIFKVTFRFSVETQFICSRQFLYRRRRRAARTNNVRHIAIFIVLAKSLFWPPHISLVFSTQYNNVTDTTMEKV